MFLPCGRTLCVHFITHNAREERERNGPELKTKRAVSPKRVPPLEGAKASSLYLYWRSLPVPSNWPNHWSLVYISTSHQEEGCGGGGGVLDLPLKIREYVVLTFLNKINYLLFREMGTQKMAPTSQHWKMSLQNHPSVEWVILTFNLNHWHDMHIQREREKIYV